MVKAGASASSAELARIAAVHDASVRPALVLGAEVDADDGRFAAVALAEKLGADVLVVPLSSRCSFPEDHPRFAGFLQPVAELLNHELGKYDTVLVVGAPVFTLHVYTPGPVVPSGTTLFHITANPGQAVSALAGESLVSSPRRALEALAQIVSGRPAKRRAAGASEAVAPVESMSPEFVLQTLAGLLPHDAVFVEEAPTHRNAMHTHLPIIMGQRFHVAASGGLGWGMPAAVGMALADPGATVVCIIGDGSSLYSIQSLRTAAQRGANVVFAVLNNSGYAAMKAFGRRLGVPNAPGLDLPDIDLTQLARGFGVPADHVTEASDVHGAL
ncbi:thiamine pyrophosphate-dependent enzyme [Arthrobacter sp. GMC3]|uniref:thiamine pyrophosphate-dependent enzyme n=1 Tax=Arthrobacter sp. GMC3 TaxID=2058894 RepID=UPI0011B0EF96|nr:thiamine pyrophosphate-dependent enzyme [Arthrobacter sp. GMC3]